MPGKGKDPRNTEGEFHVPTLEVKGGYYSGGAGTVTTVGQMWYAHADVQYF